MRKHIAKAHEGTHSKEIYLGPKIHKCPCCEFTGETKVDVKKHIDKVHEGKCNICQAVFKTTKNLKNHVYSVHEKRKPYKCSSCHYRSTFMENVGKHIKRWHDGEDVEIINVESKFERNKYDICKTYFDTKTNLENHYTGYESQIGCDKKEPFHKEEQESIKGSQRVSRGQISNPVRKNNELKKQFFCSMCKSGWSKKNNLKAHISQFHEGIKRKKKPKSLNVEGASNVLGSEKISKEDNSKCILENMELDELSNTEDYFSSADSKKFLYSKNSTITPIRIDVSKQKMAFKTEFNVQMEPSSEYETNSSSDNQNFVENYNEEQHDLNHKIVESESKKLSQDARENEPIITKFSHNLEDESHVNLELNIGSSLSGNDANDENLELESFSKSVESIENYEMITPRRNPFKCTKCDFSCRVKISMKSHIAVAHNGN